MLHRRMFTRLFVCLPLFTALTVGQVRAADERPPNFVIIYTDDMGYGDLSCYNADDLQTPRLDRMATQGAKFTAFYNSSSACSPSRGALLTGSYHARLSIRTVFPPQSPNGLHPDEVTIADMLKERGYATACIGKWHLGNRPGLMPNDQGFDYFFGIPVSHDYRYPDGNGMPLYENDRIVRRQLPDELYTQLLTDKAIAFIQRNRNRPFFVYLPHPMPHVPLAVTDPFTGKAERGLYGDVMEEIDHNVGRIVDVLERLNLHDNTMIMFLSDNGPWRSYGNHAGSTGGLRGGKRNTFEGGVRTPCIMYWPGTIAPGQAIDTPACAIDLLPTIAALTGATVPDDRVIDGINIASLIIDGSDHPQVDFDRPIVFYDYASYRLFSIRVGRWKLHLPHRYQVVDQPRHDGRRGTYRWENMGLSLYDLIEDPGESTNVINQHPQVVEQIMEHVARYRQDMGDQNADIPPGPNVRPLGQAR